MELIILGSGTCIPTLKRGMPGIVIKINGEVIVLDSGSGSLHKLLQVGVDFRELKYLFYTHTHSDHTADLVPILQAMRVSPPFNRKDALFLLGPPQFSIFLHLLTQAFGEWLLEHEFEVVIKELTNDRLQFPFGMITTAPMNHGHPCIGYRIDTPNQKSITYSGDTDYCQEIVTLASNCDILILECSFPDDEKLDGHLTPTLAARIAVESNCKHLVLTHFYPACDSIHIISICQKIFTGKITLAHDLMHQRL